MALGYKSQSRFVYSLRSTGISGTPNQIEYNDYKFHRQFHNHQLHHPALPCPASFLVHPPSCGIVRFRTMDQAVLPEAVEACLPHYDMVNKRDSQ